MIEFCDFLTLKLLLSPSVMSDEQLQFEHFAMGMKDFRDLYWNNQRLDLIRLISMCFCGNQELVQLVRGTIRWH